VASWQAASLMHHITGTNSEKLSAEGTFDINEVAERALSHPRRSAISALRPSSSCPRNANQSGRKR